MIPLPILASENRTMNLTPAKLTLLSHDIGLQLGHDMKPLTS